MCGNASLTLLPKMSAFSKHTFNGGRVSAIKSVKKKKKRERKSERDRHR